MKNTTALIVAAMLAACAKPPVSQPPVVVSAPASTAARPVPTEPTIVTLKSPSPLIAIKVMIKAGSAADPDGKEGLAQLVANALIQGAFGDPANPMTKEKLADRVQPWGEGAMPRAQVAGRTTTFNMTVPSDVLEPYVREVLTPMLSKPLFQTEELERLKTEMKSQLTNVRYENLEELGLATLDQFVNEGTGYEHPWFGTEQSVPTLGQADVRRFYEAYYRPGNMIVGISTSDATVRERVVGAINAVSSDGPAGAYEVGQPKAIEGRQALVVVEPNAPAAGVHFGFPLEINRTDDDFWALYVANVWFGTHRDSFGRLYQQIRQARGYNYGDYAYIEHWQGKPWNLFPTSNQPRLRQYFSVWLRPVGHEHAYHLAKAATWELQRLISKGLTEEQVAAAKKKAKILYLNLAETVDRLLAAKVDDAFYGMQDGFLDSYIQRVDAVTVDAVNAAIKKHLQVANMKYVLITNAANGDKLVQQLQGNDTAYGKSLVDYQLKKVGRKGGPAVWQVPEDKLDMLREDAQWADYALDLVKVEKVGVDQVFKTGQIRGR